MRAGFRHRQCLQERASDGDLVARYTYARGYIDAVAVQERDRDADNDFGDELPMLTETEGQLPATVCDPKASLAAGPESTSEPTVAAQEAFVLL